MPTLYAPGTRKRNRTFTVRGNVAGRQYEIATHAGNPRAARLAWDVFAAQVRARDAARRAARAAPRTFRQIADDYVATRRASNRTVSYIDRLCAVPIEDGGTFGELPVAAIRPSDIGRAGAILHPNAAPQTVNRAVYAVAAAVLHFAHANGERDYLVVRKLREPERASRRPESEVRDLLLANSDGARHAFLAGLFFQGFRVTELCRIDWSTLDLARGTARVFSPKRQIWKPVPLHGSFRAALANLATAGRAGRPTNPGAPAPDYVFPWRARWQVYRWLRPLADRLGIAFTPHQARHDFVSRLHEAGATDADIAAVGTWGSPRSVGLYRTVAAGHARAIIDRLPLASPAQPRGKSRGRRTK